MAENNDIVIRIFTEVLFNWNVIRQDKQIMDMLDMKNNNICINLKHTNPNIDNQIIQAYALTTSLMFLYALMCPLPDFLRNDRIIENTQFYSQID